MTSPSGTLYVGMTNNLQQRVYEHKHGLIQGFTKKYHVSRLVYFEETGDVQSAIAREKEIKKWRRSKKIALIESLSPKWQDLSEEWYNEVELSVLTSLHANHRL